MKKIKQSFGSIIVCIFELVLGVLLLIQPDKFTTAIIIAAGAVLLFMGLLSVIRYFRLKPELAMLENDLSKGLIIISLGALCVFGTKILKGIFTELTLLYGVGALIIGLVKLQGAVDFLRLKVKRWYIMAIDALLTIVLAAIIIFNPFTTTVVLWQFMAISLIVVSVLDIASLIFSSSKKEEEDQKA